MKKLIFIILFLYNNGAWANHLYYKLTNDLDHAVLFNVSESCMSQSQYTNSTSLLPGQSIQETLGVLNSLDCYSWTGSVNRKEVNISIIDPSEPGSTHDYHFRGRADGEGGWDDMQIWSDIPVNVIDSKAVEESDSYGTENQNAFFVIGGKLAP